MKRVLRWGLAPLVLGFVVVAVVPGGGQAQQLVAPAWVQNLPLANTNFLTQSTPESTQEELPGMGHKFELLGGMVRDIDPQNMTGNSGGSGGGAGGNETISRTPFELSLAFRNLPPGIKITAFDTQLGFKYYFEAGRSCFGGSPRLTLLVDADGDGDFDTDPPTGPGDPDDSPDFAAHGHPNPFAACPSEEWVYENLTDAGPRWEVTPGGSVPNIPTFPFENWDTLEAEVTGAFPDHQVLAGFLLDGESCLFAPSQMTCGKAWFDLVTIENRTLETWHDTVKPN